MDIEYIRREIALSELLGEKLPNDVTELIDFFKEITFRYNKYDNGNECWYPKNHNKPSIRIESGQPLPFTRIYYPYWNRIKRKYSLSEGQTSSLFLGMFKIMFNRSVSLPVRDRIGE